MIEQLVFHLNHESRTESRGKIGEGKFKGALSIDVPAEGRKGRAFARHLQPRLLSNHGGDR